MKTMKAMIVACLITTAFAPKPYDRRPENVVKHHVAAMKAAALDEIMADYAEDTVVITPPGLMPSGEQGHRGVFTSRRDARAVFARLTSDENIAGIRSMETHVDPLGEGVVILRWTQFGETPRQISGHDLFVIRDGEITLQDIVIDKF